MATAAKTIMATCLCGNAAHEVPLPPEPLKAYICHCNSCRHLTGTLCLTIAFMPKAYQPAQALIDRLQAYQFSKRMKFYFCPACGTKVAVRCLADAEQPDGPAHWGLPTGTFERADGVYHVAGHEHIQDTVDGGFSDFLPMLDDKHLQRWPGHFEVGEELSLPWSAPERSRVQVSPDERLHAHCLCNSINFYLSRPSDRSALANGACADNLSTFHSGQLHPSKEKIWWLRANRTKFLGGVCSCNSCRLASGMEWVEWAFVPTVNISLDKEGNTPFRLQFATLKEYRSSAGPHGARRYFCGKCGAMVFWDGDDREDLVDVAVGLLESPDGARAESWLEWRTGRLSFREDAIPRGKSLTEAVEHGLADYAKRLGQEL